MGLTSRQYQLYRNAGFTHAQATRFGEVLPRTGVTAAMVDGEIVVKDALVTSTSRIFLTAQDTSGTPGGLRVASRVPGVSFTIASTSAADTSTVAWAVYDPS